MKARYVDGGRAITRGALHTIVVLQYSEVLVQFHIRNCMVFDMFRKLVIA